MPFNNAREIATSIQAAESDRLLDEMNECRLYYENEQAPKDVPEDYQYVVRNRIAPDIDHAVARSSGGEITPRFIGIEKMTAPIEELVDQILQKNKFGESILPRIENYRHIEGYAGYYVYFDPFKISPFQSQFPGHLTIKVIRPYDFLLDPNSNDGWHEDDRFRVRLLYMPVSEARSKYGRDKRAYTRLKRTVGGIEYAVLYEVEFRKEYYVPHFYDERDQQNPLKPLQTFIPSYRGAAEGDALQLLSESPDIDAGLGGRYVDNPFASKSLGIDPSKYDHDAVHHICIEHYFTCLFSGNNFLIEPPKPTGRKGFQMIPVIYRPREASTKQPQGRVKPLISPQDSLNVTDSLIIQFAKKALKDPLFGHVDEDTASYIRDRIAENSPFINLPLSVREKLYRIPANQLPPHLVQMKQIDLQNFSDIGHTSEVSKGNLPGVMSGEAIQSIQFNDDQPLHVPRQNQKTALVEVFRRLMEIIQSDLNNPFAIIRRIQDEERVINFNKKIHGTELPQEMDNEFHHLNDAGYVNQLSTMPIPDVTVDIELNSQQAQAIELQKAQYLFSLGKMHLQDLYRAIYKNGWQGKYQRAVEWDQATQLVTQLMQLSPEQRASVAADINTLAAVENM